MQSPFALASGTLQPQMRSLWELGEDRLAQILPQLQQNSRVVTEPAMIARWAPRQQRLPKERLRRRRNYLVARGNARAVG